MIDNWDMNNLENIVIEKVREHHLDAISKMMLKLWPDCDINEEHLNCQKIIDANNETIYVAVDAHLLVGFIHLTIRTEYVEGTTSTPAAYIEGLFVEKGYRKSGIARHLVEAGENWGRSKNCTEIASDTEITNDGSISFHKSVGFKEANRVVCFAKKI